MCHESWVMCHMSCVKCQVSGVTCHMAFVTCHLSQTIRATNIQTLPLITPPVCTVGCLVLVRFMFPLYLWFFNQCLNWKILWDSEYRNQTAKFGRSGKIGSRTVSEKLIFAHRPDIHNLTGWPTKKPTSRCTFVGHTGLFGWPTFLTIGLGLS